MKTATTALILINISMAIIVFSALMPTPWRIGGCLLGVIATIFCTRRYVSLAKAK
ncbi:hypothetical protein [Lacticaseibacillus zeae]|uniref:Uncharacterized protein n=1 Tax=Lacticaseibacillus zeae subsp. silagei TaxID=3068307 RepID=A0ABD7Z782_LACZE|nr:MULTISPECIES: hypothetical protein [unclassified Lacticaseibacillus]WLV82798.1 hypothetical protein LACZS2_001986 [Lacticaseibacillus sp. NCIMB 15475]WLV85539.1 hypothetical protein LACZS1_001927 [Lacticaseibacillus sp. NCIMB 15474]